MKMGNRSVERAEEMVALETQCTIDRARSSLTAAGQDYCGMCGEEIEPARRIALPSATRCITCQERHEKRQKGLI